MRSMLEQMSECIELIINKFSAYEKKKTELSAHFTLLAQHISPALHLLLAWSMLETCISS